MRLCYGTAAANPYNIPLIKTYKKDGATTVKEENTLTADKKSIASAKAYENNVLKKQTDYDYYPNGNLWHTKEYISAGNYITTAYTYDSQGAYLASKAIGSAVHIYTYDPMGRLKTYTEPKYQGTSQI